MTGTNCSVCGNTLGGRAVYRCNCGALTHAYCWEKHVVQSHGPPFITGCLDLHGRFKPRVTVRGRTCKGDPEQAGGSARSRLQRTEATPL